MRTSQIVRKDACLPRPFSAFSRCAFSGRDGHHFANERPLAYGNDEREEDDRREGRV